MQLAKRDVLGKPVPLWRMVRALAPPPHPFHPVSVGCLCWGPHVSKGARRLVPPAPPLHQVLPAAALHAMGNFRGKKPLFKWASAAPWVEMQLQAWSTADDAPPSKVIMNGCLGLFWLSILAKVMIHLCRRYYSLSREQLRLLRIERYTTWQSTGLQSDTEVAQQVGVAPSRRGGRN